MRNSPIRGTSWAPWCFRMLPPRAVSFHTAFDLVVTESTSDRYKEAASVVRIHLDCSSKKLEDS